MPSLVVTLFSLLLELHKDEEAVKHLCDQQVSKNTELLHTSGLLWIKSDKKVHEFNVQRRFCSFYACACICPFFVVTRQYLQCIQSMVCDVVLLGYGK